VKLLSPDARAERRLAICLALIAGYVDAYGLIALGVYVSVHEREHDANRFPDRAGSE
jgi:hypothetical protein